MLKSEKLNQIIDALMSAVAPLYLLFFVLLGFGAIAEHITPTLCMFLVCSAIASLAVALILTLISCGCCVVRDAFDKYND